MNIVIRLCTILLFLSAYSLIADEINVPIAIKPVTKTSKFQNILRPSLRTAQEIATLLTCVFGVAAAATGSLIVLDTFRQLTRTSLLSKHDFSNFALFALTAYGVERFARYAQQDWLETDSNY